MGYLSVTRAVGVRLLFASHGIVSIWRLADVSKDGRFWYLSGTLGLLFIESMVTLVKRQGKEWQWFCPSVFIYLLTSVPAIWFLELHEFERRIRYSRLTTTTERFNDSAVSVDIPPGVSEDLSAPIGSVLGVTFEIRIPIKLTPDQWIRTLEQLLLLILILGRWLLPKGKLTHDQLSQLLLVYIGTAADIVEFFEAFKEKEVRYNQVLCITILGIWSTSLIQFSLVLTASRARRDQSGLYSFRTSGAGSSKGCCRADIFGILISILLQDLPFLVLRMLLIFRYNVLSYTNMFFTCKNTLVIILLTYRLVVVFVERRKEKEDFGGDNSDVSLVAMESILAKDIFPNNNYENRTLTSYPKEYNINSCNKLNTNNNIPRVYQLRQEKHKWGKAYHFEQVHTPVT